MACSPVGAPGYRKGAITFLYINQDTTIHSSRMYQQSRINLHGGDGVGAGDAGAGAASLAGAAGRGWGWGPTPPPLSQLPRAEFFMTPPSGDVLSRDAELNGIARTKCATILYAHRSNGVFFLL